MRKLAVALLVLLLTAGLAFAKGYEVSKKAGDYDVALTFDRNPPIAGDNMVSMVIKDAAGVVVKDAQVKVEASMPAMPGMPPMSNKTEATAKGDAYEAKLALSMSGPWNIAVKITRAGKSASMKFTVDAR